MDTSNTKSREDISKVLIRKFHKNSIKERVGGGGKKFSYIEGHTAVRRLIEATGNQFDFYIHESSIDPWGTNSRGKDQFLVRVLGSLLIPGLGTRQGYGVQMVTFDGGEDLFKGAETDCLKRCAMKFGVALELYGDDHEQKAGADKVGTESKKAFAAAYEKATGEKVTAAVADTAAADRFGEGKTFNGLLEKDVTKWIVELEASTKSVAF
jgi:hypothetical protein